MTTHGRLGCVSLLALVLVLVGSTGGVAEEGVLPTPIWFSSELEVGPEGSAEGLWVCRFVLRDLASEEVLVAPTVVFPEGEPAKVESSLPGGTEFTLEVRVEEGGGVASWIAEVRFEGQVLSVQKGAVQLGR